MLAVILTLVAAQATITVQDSGIAKPISDLVYGRNDLSFGRIDTNLPYPLIRFGGNATSRYNWEANAWNSGADWFYLNSAFPYADSVGSAKGRFSYSDVILLKQAQKGLSTILTVPTIGWVTKDRGDAWGSSVKAFGPQQAVEQERSHGDAGNGKKPDGSPLKQGNPGATSIKASPEFMAKWVKHNREMLKQDGGKPGSQIFYALDNEPNLWHQTHQDIRYGDKSLRSPELGYDELWERTASYAKAIRAADPEAKIMGPVAWGWCDYMSSAKDQCKSGPDRAAHGGTALLPWYLAQVCAYQKRTGIKLVDYLDIHYYPESEKGIEDESPTEQAKRLEAPRSLYEKGFKDGSWIPEPIVLIPRMQNWIKDACPGTKLAITEYRFGVAAEGLTSSIANAEALAIFGREGVDLATFWGHLVKGSRLEGAFGLYLNYDQRGASALGGASVPTAVKAEGEVTAYTIRTKDRELVYVFNKSGKDYDVAIGGLNGYTLSRAFSFDANSVLHEVAPRKKVPSRAVTLFEYVKPRSRTGKGA